MNLYIYIYIYIGGWGSEFALVAVPRNREIDFGFVFVFVSCRASGLGEAAGGREGGDSPLAGASNSEFRRVVFAWVPLFCAQACGF